MKKFIGSTVLWVMIGLLLVAVAALVLLSIGATFIDIKNFAIKLGYGSLIKGLLLLPFFIVGCVYVVRGFFAVGEKDGENIPFKHKWQESLYFIIMLVSYIAFVIGIGGLL